MRDVYILYQGGRWSDQSSQGWGGGGTEKGGTTLFNAADLSGELEIFFFLPDVRRWLRGLRVN